MEQQILEIIKYCRVLHPLHPNPIITIEMLEAGDVSMYAVKIGPDSVDDNFLPIASGSKKSITEAVEDLHRHIKNIMMETVIKLMDAACMALGGSQFLEEEVIDFRKMVKERKTR